MQTKQAKELENPNNYDSKYRPKLKHSSPRRHCYRRFSPIGVNLRNYPRKFWIRENR